MAAQGTFTLFDDFVLQLGEKIHDFPSGGEDYKMALINATKVAAATDADAKLADYTECSGGTYAAQALANQDFTLSADTATRTREPGRSTAIRASCTWMTVPTTTRSGSSSSPWMPGQLL